jgi:hypothetical protein
MDKDMRPVVTTDGEGNKRWMLNGKFHREHGPAIVYVNGTKWWALYGKRHRTDGPAIECDNGHKEWFLNGYSYTFDEWLDKNQELTDEEKVMMKLKYG